MIVFYLPDLRAGGAERVMVNLITYYHLNDNFHIALLLGKKEGKLLDQIPEDISIYSLNASSAKSSVIPLIRFCKEHKPKVVFATLGASLAISLAKPFIPKGIKIINRLGNTIGAEKLLYSNPIKKFGYILANKIIARASDKLVFQCNYMAEDYINETRIKPNNYIVIYNPVDIVKMEQLVKNKMSQKFDLIAVGRLDRQKDYPTLINACGILKEKGVSFSLAILGDGKLKEQLLNLIEDNGLRNHVHLLGHTGNPYIYMASAKYLISSSLYEGFSNVIVEALCLGIPIISTDCPGGNKETIITGFNGYLSPVGDVKELANCIQLALSESDNFSKEMIRKTAIEKYKLRTIAEQYKLALIQ